MRARRYRFGRFVRSYAVRVSTDGAGWGTFLDTIRVEKGWKDDAELARRIGVNQSLISNWRSGSQPTIERLRSIADATGISLLRLMVESGHITEDEAEGKAPPAPESPQFSAVEAVMADRLLSAEARRVMADLYGLLVHDFPGSAYGTVTARGVTDLDVASAHSSDAAYEDGPGLRAVARPRRRGDGNRDDRA